MPKIAQVIPYFYPSMAYGGPAKVVYEYTKELSQNFPVAILTSDAYDRNNRIATKDKLTSSTNFQVHYFKNIGNSIAFSKRLFTHFGLLWHILRNYSQYSLFHFHDVFIIPQIISSYILRLFKKPYIVSPHGVLDPVRLQKKNVVKKLLKPFVDDMLHHAKALVATSEKEANILKKHGYKNVVTIYNGVAMTETKNNHEFKRFQNNELLTILYIGKLHPQKGLFELLQALTLTNQQFQLLVAGPDDGDKDRLANFVATNKLSNVHFLGFVNESDKESLYEVADLFIHPSHSEGFSISILEALSHELPVLITEACNFPDVEKYNAGIIIRKPKPDILSKALTNITQEQLHNKQPNTRKLIEKKYSIPVMAEKLLDLYEQYI